jgi:DNA repair protein RadC
LRVAGIRLIRDRIEAGRDIRVTVHDHVIVSSQGRSSMKAMGLV